jgi:hypothetical protein
MNSTGMLLPTQQSTSMYDTVGRTPVSGTAVSTGAVYVPPAGANVTSVQQPLVPIEINWRKDPRVKSAVRPSSSRRRTNARSFIGSNNIWRVPRRAARYSINSNWIVVHLAAARPLGQASRDHLTLSIKNAPV